MLAPNIAELLIQAEVFAKAKVLLIGPGLGRTPWAQRLYSLITSEQQITSKIQVVDADALYFLTQQPIKNNNRVITPHPKEAAMLLNCTVADIEQDRFAAVEQLVQKYGGICVLKGAGSLVCNGHQTYINTSGNAGMASGGMGDVLSGIIAALSLQMADLFTAVKLAVYLHGNAADIIAKQQGQCGMLASDLFLSLQASINGKMR
jgi:NAD(P)H-hydrate epimerase